ncbi:hypothetical protein ACFX1X_013417 [Malus domestica]
MDLQIQILGNILLHLGEGHGFLLLDLSGGGGLALWDGGFAVVEGLSGFTERDSRDWILDSREWDFSKIDLWRELRWSERVVKSLVEVEKSPSAPPGPRRTSGLGSS